MKITDVTVTPLKTSEKSISGGPDAALVTIETDDGITGIGETCAHSERSEAALAVKDIVEIGFKPQLLGENPFEIGRIWEKLYTYSEWYGRRGIAMYGMSGIDVALWDIMGKALHLPASTLLGGAYRKKIRVYASMLFDMQDFEATADEAKSYVKEGYTAVKFGWGQTRETSYGLDAEKDEAIVRTLRERLGDKIDIMVDVGRFVNWSLPHAIKMANRLAKYNIFWLEEALPQEDLEAYSELRNSTDVYIAAGEGEYTRYGFRDWIVKRAVDILQPDVTKAGGLTEARRIAEACDLWNIMLVPHGFSSAINVAANLQLVAAMPRAFLLEFRRTASPLINRLVKKPLKAENGYLTIPDGPGLGIELDQSVVEECTLKVRSR